MSQFFLRWPAVSSPATTPRKIRGKFDGALPTVVELPPFLAQVHEVLFTDTISRWRRQRRRPNIFWCAAVAACLVGRASVSGHPT
jgi:hypothetical protein